MKHPVYGVESTGISMIIFETTYILLCLYIWMEKFNENENNIFSTSSSRINVMTWWPELRTDQLLVRISLYFWLKLTLARKQVENFTSIEISCISYDTLFQHREFIETSECIMKVGVNTQCKHVLNQLFEGISTTGVKLPSGTFRYTCMRMETLMVEMGKTAAKMRLYTNAIRKTILWKI